MPGMEVTKTETLNCKRPCLSQVPCILHPSCSVSKLVICPVIRPRRSKFKAQPHACQHKVIYRHGNYPHNIEMEIIKSASKQCCGDQISAYSVCLIKDLLSDIFFIKSLICSSDISKHPTLNFHLQGEGRGGVDNRTRCS